MPTSQSGLLRAPASPSATLRAPLVGRGLPLRELDEALARALETKTPQIVTVLGSAGIGKTRLVHEFLARVRERDRHVRAFRGTCRENGPPFSVVQRILKSRFGVIEGGDAETTREEFRQKVSETLGDRRVTEFLHFLGAFLDLRFPESPFIKAVEDDPQQFSKISRAVLRRFFEVDAENHPLILTFEDLHWATDDTLELVAYLTSTLASAPVLLVHVARPELLARQSDWLSHGGAAHTRLDLGPLGADDAAMLMQRLLAPTGDPPQELVDAGVDMAGGSPYLLEQMVRTFQTSGTVVPRGDGTWAVDLSRLDDAQLPLTVEDAISARIAALEASERQVLEMAATMGGVFWLGALVALARIDKPTPALWGGTEDVALHFRDLLHGLEEREYVLELPDSSVPGNAEFAFKHNLERETLHRLTSRAQIRRYHMVVAEWLEFRLAENAEEQCEVLAGHFEAGGARRKAGLYYLMAGDRARSRYANAKAAEYYGQGLALIGEEDVPQRLDALHHHGDVLQLAGRNEEALTSFRQMLAIAYRLDLKSKGGAAHNRIGRLYRAIGQLEEAMRHLGTAHALFDAAGDKRGVASSLDDVGKVHWMRGAYEVSERFMKQGLELRRELGDARSIALSLNNLGLVYQDSGRFAEALEAYNEALMLRREIGDRPGISQTLNNLGDIREQNGEHVLALALWTEALELAREVGDRMRQAVILTNLGQAHYRLGRPEDAIRGLQQAEEISATLGDRLLEGEILRGLAKAHMLALDLTSARTYIARSVSLFQQARSKPFLGVALRTLGEIGAAAGGGDEETKGAREAFERSIMLFEELGNDLELAHGCRAYAGFLRQIGEANPDLLAAADGFEARAAGIDERLKSADGVIAAPLPGEKTDPGASAPTPP
jgi:tetratricopeptide (TPR) repeat protein